MTHIRESVTRDRGNNTFNEWRSGDLDRVTVERSCATGDYYVNINKYRFSFNELKHLRNMLTAIIETYE